MSEQYESLDMNCLIHGIYHKHPVASGNDCSCGGSCQPDIGSEAEAISVVCPFAASDLVRAVSEHTKALRELAAAEAGGEGVKYPSAASAGLHGCNDYQEIKGTLHGTSEKASPYSFFSLTKAYGLREMWDSEHAAYYGTDVKHLISDYVKPVGVYYDDNGIPLVRAVLMTADGTEHCFDYEAVLAKDDPEFIAEVLNSMYGFGVFEERYTVFGRALTVVRLEDEQLIEDTSLDEEKSTVSGVIIHQILQRDQEDVVESLRAYCRIRIGENEIPCISAAQAAAKDGDVEPMLYVGKCASCRYDDSEGTEEVEDFGIEVDAPEDPAEDPAEDPIETQEDPIETREDPAEGEDDQYLPEIVIRRPVFFPHVPHIVSGDVTEC